MIVGKIRVENFRGMSLGLYDENNRLHATAVTERADLQAICDGYNAFFDLQGGIVVGHNFKADEGPVDPPPAETYTTIATEANGVPVSPVDLSEQPRRGRGRPRKEATE